MTLEEILTPAQRQQLDAIARQSQRTAEQVAAEMLAASIADTTALLETLRESIAQADRGEVMTLDEWAAQMKELQKKR